MKIVPLGDKIVVKRLESDETTAGGIVLPDAARDVPQQGRVLSVGDGRLLPDGTRSPHEVHEGDRVVFG
ncbi:MAG: co-chaperone GroES, partial [Nocardioidaceae bacterium]|nr:co-chaperone GroES [Nocardioidaceae bacterium]